MRVLAIGNSFSQDASRYLHQIAEADGVDIEIVNLYIGGCSLERHYNNIKNNIADYDYELNGSEGIKKVTVDDALNEGDWDVITMQQVSGLSGKEETYYPYITDIFDYVKSKSPKSRFLIHQTWAYEKGSDHPDFPLYDCDREKMHNALVSAYKNVADKLGLDIIPCGEAMMKARENEVFDTVMGDNNPLSLHRDGFHASLVYGRYLLGAVWYEKLTGNDIRSNTYLPDGFDKSVLDLIKDAVHNTVK